MSAEQYADHLWVDASSGMRPYFSLRLIP